MKLFGFLLIWLGCILLVKAIIDHHFDSPP
jgi:hypothetical protein